MTTQSLDRDRAIVARYGPPDQALNTLMAGAKSSKPKVDFLEQNPDYFIDHVAQLVDEGKADARTVENAIRYARSYAACWHFPSVVPASTTERINALEERWLSKLRVAG